MPLLQFDLIKGRTDQEIQKILDVAHKVVITSFGVPDSDRYQIVYENETKKIIAKDTGLNLKRTDNFILIRVYTSPRSKEQKHIFMKNLAHELEKNCGISGDDLMISFFVNTKDDWSFANGEPQYSIGKL